MAQFWDRIDFEAQTACRPTSKDGAPESCRAGRLLRQLPRRSDLVFDIGVKELCNSWNRICEEAKIEDLHMHGLRHEGVSCAAESGLFPTVLDLQAYS
ncbi:MAG TPA: hypothetical protein VGM97_20365 [Steroidobacteraceae bacterium]